MRYFTNRLAADYVSGQPVQVDVARCTQYIVKTVDAIRTRMPPTTENCDGGLYVGCAGVAYALYRLATSEQLTASRDRLLAAATEYVDVALQYATKRKGRDPTTAFLLGPAGVMVVGSLVLDAVGRSAPAADLRKQYASMASAVCKSGDFLGCGSDEYFVGRAGYLCGSLVLNAAYRQQVVPVSSLIAVCQSIVDSGRSYAAKHRSPAPLMYAYYKTEYLGAAHGLSSILQMLLSCKEYIKSDPDAERDIRASVDFMLSLMQPNGNIAPAMDEVGPRAHYRPASEELVHWCHGAPGIVYLFAKAHLMWPDDGRYLAACERCAELTWQCGLLKKGPGICHGVAGSGYVFLLLYRLTGNKLYLHRAMRFAEFLETPEFLNGARTPDTPYSLYEGLAGTVCFVADIMQPQKAEFPFFDVFM